MPDKGRNAHRTFKDDPEFNQGNKKAGKTATANENTESGFKD